MGGYAFIHLCYYTRFRAQSLTGQRLIFETAIAGFLAVVPARILVLLLQDCALLVPFKHLWQEAVGETVLVGTLCLAVLLAPAAAVIGNVASSWSSRAQGKGWKEKSRALALRRAVETRGTRLQKVLYDAAIAAASEKLLVELVMSDKRVYIGWVAEAPNLRHNEQFVPLLPFWTGHLTTEELKLKLTQRHIRDEELEGGPLRNRHRYVFVLPVPEIRSARLIPFGGES